MKKISLFTIFLSTLLLTACNKDTKEYVHIGPNWAALNSIKPSEKTFKVDINAVDSAIVGETLAFKVKSEQQGQLWVLQVDSSDEISQIYPNPAVEDNQIIVNKWKKIPEEGSTWSIEAMKPLGPSVIVFIVTSPGTDLSTVFNGQPKNMDKALRVVENASAWGLAKQVIDIKDKK